MSTNRQVKTYDRGYSQTHPQAQILGLGYDRNLGGLDLQIILRDYLAVKFNEMGKTKTDVTKVPRAMAKIFKEARTLFKLIDEVINGM